MSLGYYDEYKRLLDGARKYDNENSVQLVPFSDEEIRKQEALGPSGPVVAKVNGKKVQPKDYTGIIEGPLRAFASSMASSFVGGTAGLVAAPIDYAVRKLGDGSQSTVGKYYEDIRNNINQFGGVQNTPLEKLAGGLGSGAGFILSSLATGFGAGKLLQGLGAAGKAVGLAGNAAKAANAVGDAAKISKLQALKELPSKIPLVNKLGKGAGFVAGQALGEAGMEGSDTYFERVNENPNNPDAAALAGAINFGANIPLDLATDAIGYGGIKGLMGKTGGDVAPWVANKITGLVKRGVSPKVAEAIVRGGMTAASEGVQEMGQSALEQYLNSEYSTWSDDVFSKEGLANIAESGLYGALTGGIMGGAGSLNNTRKADNFEKIMKNRYGEGADRLNSDIQALQSRFDAPYYDKENPELQINPYANARVGEMINERQQRQAMLNELANARTYTDKYGIIDRLQAAGESTKATDGGLPTAQQVVNSGELPVSYNPDYQTLDYLNAQRDLNSLLRRAYVNNSRDLLTAEQQGTLNQSLDEIYDALDLYREANQTETDKERAIKLSHEAKTKMDAIKQELKKNGITYNSDMESEALAAHNADETFYPRVPIDWNDISARDKAREYANARNIDRPLTAREKSVLSKMKEDGANLDDYRIPIDEAIEAETLRIRDKENADRAEYIKKQKEQQKQQQEAERQQVGEASPYLIYNQQQGQAEPNNQTVQQPVMTTARRYASMPDEQMQSADINAMSDEDRNAYNFERGRRIRRQAYEQAWANDGKNVEDFRKYVKAEKPSKVFSKVVKISRDHAGKKSRYIGMLKYLDLLVDANGNSQYDGVPDSQLREVSALLNKNSELIDKHYSKGTARALHDHGAMIANELARRKQAAAPQNVNNNVNNPVNNNEPVVKTEQKTPPQTEKTSPSAPTVSNTSTPQTETKAKTEELPQTPKEGHKRLPVYTVSDDPKQMRSNGNVDIRKDRFDDKSRKSRTAVDMRDEFKKQKPDAKVLDISAFSDSQLGKDLSGHKLSLKPKKQYTEDGQEKRGRRYGYKLESVYQSSKVFEGGKQHSDLLDTVPYAASEDRRLTTSGKLTGFSLSDKLALSEKGKDFGLAPATGFYNWLYVNALNENPKLAKQLEQYDSFTDVMFDPERGKASQAEAASIYVSLKKHGKLDEALKSYDDFVRVVYGIDDLANYTEPTVEIPPDRVISTPDDVKTTQGNGKNSTTPVENLHKDENSEEVEETPHEIIVDHKKLTKPLVVELDKIVSESLAIPSVKKDTFRRYKDEQKKSKIQRLKAPIEKLQQLGLDDVISSNKVSCKETLKTIDDILSESNKITPDMYDRIYTQVQKFNTFYKGEIDKAKGKAETREANREVIEKEAKRMAGWHNLSDSSKKILDNTPLLTEEYFKDMDEKSVKSEISRLHEAVKTITKPDGPTATRIAKEVDEILNADKKPTYSEYQKVHSDLMNTAKYMSEKSGKEIQKEEAAEAERKRLGRKKTREEVQEEINETLQLEDVLWGRGKAQRREFEYSVAVDGKTSEADKAAAFKSVYHVDTTSDEERRKVIAEDIHKNSRANFMYSIKDFVWERISPATRQRVFERLKDDCERLHINVKDAGIFDEGIMASEDVEKSFDTYNKIAAYIIDYKKNRARGIVGADERASDIIFNNKAKEFEVNKKKLVERFDEIKEKTSYQNSSKMLEERRKEQSYVDLSSEDKLAYDKRFRKAVEHIKSYVDIESKGVEELKFSLKNADSELELNDLCERYGIDNSGISTEEMFNILVDERMQVELDREIKKEERELAKAERPIRIKNLEYLIDKVNNNVGVFENISESRKKEIVSYLNDILSDAKEGRSDNRKIDEFSVFGSKNAINRLMFRTEKVDDDTINVYSLRDKKSRQKFIDTVEKAIELLEDSDNVDTNRQDEFNGWFKALDEILYSHSNPEKFKAEKDFDDYSVFNSPDARFAQIANFMRRNRIKIGNYAAFSDVRNLMETSKGKRYDGTHHVAPTREARLKYEGLNYRIHKIYEEDELWFDGAEPTARILTTYNDNDAFKTSFEEYIKDGGRFDTEKTVFDIDENGDYKLDATGEVETKTQKVEREKQEREMKAHGLKLNALHRVRTATLEDVQRMLGIVDSDSVRATGDRITYQTLTPLPLKENSLKALKELKPEAEAKTETQTETKEAEAARVSEDKKQTEARQRQHAISSLEKISNIHETDRKTYSNLTSKRISEMLDEYRTLANDSMLIAHQDDNVRYDLEDVLRTLKAEKHSLNNGDFGYRSLSRVQNMMKKYAESALASANKETSQSIAHISEIREDKVVTPTIESVKTMFHGQHTEQLSNGDFRVKLKNGRTVIITTKKTIEISDSDIAKAHGNEALADVKSGKASVAGVAYRTKSGSVIELAEGLATNFTANHELAHVAVQLALTDNQIKVLQKRVGSTSEEDIADFISEQLTGEYRKEKPAMRKIMETLVNFRDRFISWAFGKDTAGKILSDIKTGKIWSQETQRAIAEAEIRKHPALAEAIEEEAKKLEHIKDENDKSKPSDELLKKHGETGWFKEKKAAVIEHLFDESNDKVGRYFGRDVQGVLEESSAKIIGKAQYFIDHGVPEKGIKSHEELAARIGSNKERIKHFNNYLMYIAQRDRVKRGGKLNSELARLQSDRDATQADINEIRKQLKAPDQNISGKAADKMLNRLNSLNSHLSKVKHDIEQTERKIAGTRTLGKLTQYDDQIAALDAEYSDFRSIAEEYWKIGEHQLERMRDLGICSEAQFKAMRKANPHYVPLYRELNGDSDLTSMASDISNGILGMHGELVNYQGGKHDVIPPVEQLLQMEYHIQQLESKQKTISAIAKHAESGDYGTLARCSDVDNHGANEDKLMYYVDGKKKYVILDSYLAQVVKSVGSNNDAQNIVSTLCKTTSNALVRAATSHPGFAIKNMIEDSFASSIINPEVRPVIDTVKGLMHAWKFKTTGMDEVYLDCLKHGGIQGANRWGREGVKADLKSAYKANDKGVMANLRKLAGWFETLSEISEAATRVGTYQRLVECGVSKEDAAFRTIDQMWFGRRGKISSKYFNNYGVPFASASLAGTYSMMKAIKAHPKNALMKSMLYFGIPSMLLTMLNLGGDDDETKKYLSIPQETRDQNFVFMTAGGVITIPKPRGLTGAMCSMLERSLEHACANDKTEYGNFAKTFIEGFTPNLTPLLLRLFDEVRSNHSYFTGRDIVPKNLEKYAPTDRYSLGTSSTAKWLSKRIYGTSNALINVLSKGSDAGIEIAPPMIEHVGRSLLGSWYGTVGNLAPNPNGRGYDVNDTTSQGFVDSLSRLPVANRFFHNSDNYRRYVNNFYDEFNEVAQRVESAKRAVADGKTRDELSNQDKFYYGAKNTVSSISSRFMKPISNLRSEIRDIENNKRYSPDKKRMLIQQRIAKMNLIAQKGMEQIERLKSKKK